NPESTWTILNREFGEVSYSTTMIADCSRVLDRCKAAGERIFSAAYIMPSKSQGFKATAKHRNYLQLIQKMVEEGLPEKLAEAKSMAEAFALLKSYPLIGNFLAYQYVTDLNYST